MVGAVFRKELLESLLTYRFFVALGLFTLLFPVSFYGNARDLRRRQAEYLEMTQSWLEQTRTALHEGRFQVEAFRNEAYRPPSPLRIFAVGLESFIPNHIVSTYQGLVRVEGQPGLHNPMATLMGSVDLVYVAGWVLSLLAFVFAFDTVAGEKERGTLRLLMANPLTRWQVLVGKGAGSAVALGTAFVVGLLVGGLVLAGTHPDLLFSRTVLGRLALMLAVVFVFLVGMVFLGVFVSTLTFRAATAMVLLILIWTFLALVVPRVSPMLAESFYPIESPQAFHVRQTLVRQALEREWDRARRDLFEETLVRHGVWMGQAITSAPRTPEEQAAFKAYEEARNALDRTYARRIQEQMDRMERDYQNRYLTQVRIARWLSRISPVSSLVYVLTELAGTGFLELENVRANAYRFHEQTRASIYDKVIVHWFGSHFGTAVHTEYAPGFDPGTAMPPALDYRLVPLGRVWQEIWVDVALLGCFMTAAFLGALVRFLRYDIR